MILVLVFFGFLSCFNLQAKNTTPIKKKPTKPAQVALNDQVETHINVQDDRTTVFVYVPKNMKYETQLTQGKIAVMLKGKSLMNSVKLHHETGNLSTKNTSSVEYVSFDKPNQTIYINLKKGSELIKNEVVQNQKNKNNKLVFDVSVPAMDNLTKAGIAATGGYEGVDLDSFILTSLDNLEEDEIGKIIEASSESFPFNLVQKNTNISAFGKAAPFQDSKSDLQKPIIVIDAGHGGEDPGTIGLSSKEKNVNLKYAITLYTMLKKTGRYDVKLTRNGDYFIKLQDRRELAREAKADLFISIHSDASPNKNTSGLSIYTLSEEAADSVALRLMEQNNAENTINGVDFSTKDDYLSQMFIDMSQRSSKNDSTQFANLVLNSAKNTGVSLLRQNPHSAGFAVLKGPDTPSVLIEIGFLSNKKEEKMLNSNSYRNKIAQAITESIDKFFENKKMI